MKKLIYLLIILLFATIATSQTINWVKTTNNTVYWDAVAKVATTDDPVKYQMWSRPDGSTTATMIGTPITATTYALTMPVDWKGYVGVTAQRWVSGAKTAESEIAWSDNPVVAPSPFGFDTWRGINWPNRIRLTP